jgi:LysR family transcriptional regulator, cell division regulator
MDSSSRMGHMLPNASDLQFFLEVAKTQNMSRASERIGITQPALSQAIKRLEHSFGQDLLLRSKGGVTLTKSGEKLAYKARELLDAWEKLRDDAVKDGSEIRGRYSIGCHPSVALYTLGNYVPQLLQKFPDLDLKFQHDLSRKITEDVISFKLDIGIVVNPVAHPDLVIKELYKDEVTFWRSKKLNPNIELENDKKVLVYDPDLLQSQDLLAKLSKRKIEFQRSLTSTSLEVIRKLVVSGAGIGILPGRVVGSAMTKLELVDPKWPKYQDRICLIFRVDTQKSLAAKALIHFIFDSLLES